MYADIAKLALLAASVGLCLYSAGIKLYEAENRPVVGLRKLSPDYIRFCGMDRANGVKEDSPQEKRRNLCKTVVSDATKDAQTKCNSYLENERDCRILRGNVAQCMAFTLDADGCVGMVVRAAVEKAGPTVTP